MILMDGKILAEMITEGLSKEVSSLNFVPRLVVIQLGGDAASTKYITMKQKTCEQVGIEFVHLKYDSSINVNDLKVKIRALNTDKTVSGILVQLPLPKSIDKQNLIDNIDPTKDVDGLTTENMKHLSKKELGLYPATAEGIIKLLRYYGIKMKNAKTVVIGRSNLVGKPVAQMLLAEGARVTVCHSHTKNISEYTKVAEIIVTAVGQTNLLTADMVKKGTVVVDVGMDVDFDKVSKIVDYITPPTGGVGPMTVAMLISNVVKALKIQKEA
jgi:methylenetetrahydrofolate dehydrogenase (NADP+)/methenyltetrahydrofolate cyclohydrolase